MKKGMIALAMLAAACMLMAGCAANATGADATMTPEAAMTPAASDSPTAGPAMSAEPTASPEASAAPASQSMTPAQAGKLADDVSDAVERISEIDDAEVIVSGNRALVAVEFDDQYSAGLDERMKELITQTVQKVDASLTDVQITDDDTLYGQVKGLGERVAQATGLDELADDFGDLWDRITGM